MQPALVVPALADTLGDIERMTPANRKKVVFHCVPYEFFYRDGWPDAQEQDEIRRVVHSDKSVVNFLESSINERKKMHDKLLETLASNENDFEVDDDAEIANALRGLSSDDEN
ncbi:MAG: hypothetical protein QMA97_04800 [Glaciecola sp.]